MLFYFILIKAYEYPNNIKILEADTIVTPKSNSFSHLIISDESEGEAKLSMKKNKTFKDIQTTVKFAREFFCEGYSIYVNKTKICFDKMNEKLIKCTGKKDEFMMWDVQNEDNGYTICTAQPYNMGLGYYHYQYCLTILNTRNQNNEYEVAVKYNDSNSQDRLFKIYYKSTGKLIDEK